MRVDFERRGRAVVAELLAHVGDRLTERYQQAGEEVPQVVEPILPKPRLVFHACAARAPASLSAIGADAVTATGAAG